MGFVKIARHLLEIATRNFKEKRMSFLLIGPGATRQARGTQPGQGKGEGEHRYRAAVLLLLWSSVSRARCLLLN